MLKRFDLIHSVWIGLILNVALSSSSLHAQQNLKPQTAADSIRISFKAEDLRFEEVLEIIEEESGFVFSYNPRRIPINQKLSYTATNTSLLVVLEELGIILNVEFEIVEEQIVVKPVREEKDKEVERHTLSGFIKDSKTGETMIGATVILEDMSAGAVSNPYGFYSLSLTQGSYTLLYSFVGYSPIRKIVQLNADITMDIDMEEMLPLLPEVIVRSSKISLIEEVQMGKVELTPVEVREMPALLGEPDVIKSLQLLPGIKLHSDGSTFFYVRGGDKDQNLIIVDEAPIFNPSHLLGFFSTIIPEAVKDIDIYKADMPTAMGGRLSSVIDVKTRDGNLKNFQLWGSLGVVSSKLGIEGPFKKDYSSYFLTGRFSRIKWFVKQSEPNVEKFSFYDLTGKVNFKLNDRNRIYGSFYSGSDFYEVESNSGINWNNIAGTIRWNHLFSDRLFANTTFHSSKYDYFLVTDSDKNEKWNSHIANATLKSDFTLFKNPKNTISFGILLGFNNFNPGNLESDDPDSLNTSPIVSRKSAEEFVIYADQELRLSEKWGLRYGLRLGSWTTTAVEGTFEYLFDENGQPIDRIDYEEGESYNTYGFSEPRFSLSHFISENSSVKLSYGHNVQNIHLISNSISPFTSLEVWLPSSINIKPQTSDQVSMGYYKRFPNTGIELETEIYYKYMNHQIDYIDHANMLLNPAVEGQLLFGKAKAYGLEVMVRKDEGRIRGWIGYTLSSVKKKFNEINNGTPFPAFYDRPNEINLFLTYDLTPRLNLGLNWNFSTGAAFTSPSSFYYYDGQELPLFANRNNDRFPAYHRLDLNAEYQLSKEVKKFEHSLSFSIFNVYGRNNSIFQNFNKTYADDGKIVIPANLFDPSRIYTQTYLYNIVPSVSYNFKFL